MPPDLRFTTIQSPKLRVRVSSRCRVFRLCQLRTCPQGDGALPIERPVHLSGSAVRSRGATHKGRESGSELLRLSLICITPHLDRLLLLDLPLKATSTAKACAMGL